MTAAPGTVGDNGNGLVVPKRRHRFAPGEPAPEAEPAAQAAHAAPRPLSRRERKKLGRLRARKVHRVVRHVDPWSVLRLSLLFYFCLFVVAMVAGTLLYNVAGAAGTIDNIEKFIKDIGAFEKFTFEGPKIFRASLLAGLVLVVAGTALNVLMAVLFNLISDLVGGVRITVIEEETARPIPSSADVNKR